MRPGKTRRRRRLYAALMLDEGLSRGKVRMLWRIEQANDRSRTGITAFEQFRPLSPRLRQEHGLELLLQLGPFCAIVLRIEGVVGETGKLAQVRIKLRLDRADDM